MIRIILIVLIGMFSMVATAAEDSQTTQYLHKGLIELGGGFGFSSTQRYSSFYVSPFAGYFLTDSFMVGGSVSYSTASGSSDSVGVSPVFKYYVYTCKEIATYISQSFGFVWSGASPQTRATTALGAQYFLNQHAAFGVSFNYTYDLSRYDDATAVGDILGSFSIFY